MKEKYYRRIHLKFLIRMKIYIYVEHIRWSNFMIDEKFLIIQYFSIFFFILNFKHFI